MLLPVPCLSSRPSSSLPVLPQEINTVWGQDATAMNGLLLLHSQAASGEGEHCLLVVL